MLNLDECATSAKTCDVNAACQNTVGSRTCTCRAGYTGNGRTCKGTKLGEICNISCCLKSHLPNLINCNYMFIMTDADIDECSANSHNCGVNAVCSNAMGSYACACKAGYSGDGRKCTGELSDVCLKHIVKSSFRNTPCI